jgi:hypothetical protein
MSLEKHLLDVEKRLWRNDAGLYHDNLTDEALLVFPETGVITRDVAVDAILAENAEGRKWAEADFEGVRCVRLTEDVALLTYRVTARWEHEARESPALASSVYLRSEGVWKLAFHQQSPLGAG